MNATEDKTSALATIGALFEYPGETFQERFEEADEAAGAFSADAADALGEFWRELSGVSTEHAQELYSRSFDLSPVCAPYASVHLFGAESFKRAELMTGLIAAYVHVGFDRGTELPDHIALLLQCAPRFDAEEWDDLAALVLTPALEKMGEALAKAGSPWRHAAHAAQALLRAGDESDDH